MDDSLSPTNPGEISPPEGLVDATHAEPMPQVLDLLCRTVGLGFAAVARVTETRWTACAVHDAIGFGLKPGDELDLATTLCREVRQAEQTIAIDDATIDPRYRDHPTPRRYGFRSYIAVPIRLPGGEFFGTLCALDPRPARVDTPEIRHTVTLFANLIGMQLGVARRVEIERAAAEALREEREQLRTVFEQAPDDAILVLGLDRTLTAWNPAAERITGWPAAEAIGQSADIIFTSEDRSAGVPAEETAVAARDGKAVDERWHVRKDGSRFWGSGTMNALHAADGSVRGFLKVFRDATARHEQTRTLTFLRQLGDTVMSLDDADRVIKVALRMLGEHLRVDRTLIAEAMPDGETVVVPHVWSLPHMPALPSAHRLADYGERLLADYHQNRLHVRWDATAENPPGMALEALRAIGAVAAIDVPVLVDGRLRGLVVVHQATPRQWTSGEIDLMRQVADRLIAEVGRARAMAELRGSEHRLRLALSGGGMGVWTFDPATDDATWDAALEDLTGLPCPPDGRDCAATFFAHIDPADRTHVRADVDRVIRDGGQYRHEFRLRRPDGRTIWLAGYATAVEQAAGRRTLTGVNFDVTDRVRAEAALQESEQRFRAVQETSPDGFMVLDSVRDPASGAIIDFRWSYVNDSALRIIDRPREALLGRRLLEEMPGNRDEGLFDEYVRVCETGVPMHREFRYARDGVDVFLRVAAAKAGDGFAVSFADLSERRRAEEALRVTARRDALRSRLADALRPLAAPTAIQAAACQVLGEELGVTRVFYTEVIDDEYVIDAQFVQGGPPLPPGRYSVDAFGEQVIGDYRAGRTLVLADAAVDPRLSPDARAMWASVRCRGAVGVPLVKGGKLVAVLGIHTSDPRAWVADEVVLVEEAAERTWSAVERARAESALRRSGERLRTLQAASSDVMYGMSPDWSEMRHLDGGSFIADTDGPNGLWMDKYIHPDDQPKVRAAIAAAVADKRVFELEHRVLRADGTVGWTASRAVPMLGADGEIVEWFGAASDVTDRVQARLALEESRRQLQAALADREASLERERAARAGAEQAGRMKDEFLATLSHELRTPLSAILGWSQILGRGTTEPGAVAEGLRTIERNARAQTQIIEDLLDMSRIISGKVALDARPIDAADVVRAAIETVRATAIAKVIDLCFDVPNAERFPATGDFNRLQQVFWNLLSNAIKFTPRGGTVTVAVGQRHSMWQVDVADTGEGMSPEFLPYVFDRFRQADASTTRRHGGLGLGLSIVKQLVELHGGTIRARSEGPGRGSTFTVSLPVRILHAAADPVAADPLATAFAGAQSLVSDMTAVREGAAWDPSLCEAVRGRRAVIIDDEPDARALLKRLLGDCGLDVIVTATADEALAAIERDRPDVLVSDIGMPIVDGYELIRRVRALPAERGGRTPAIALTAYARVEDRMRAVRAGFQTHVPKPVEPAELITMIASVMF